jgi:hypothetical protein
VEENLSGIAGMKGDRVWAECSARLVGAVGRATNEGLQFHKIPRGVFSDFFSSFIF